MLWLSNISGDDFLIFISINKLIYLSMEIVIVCVCHLSSTCQRRVSGLYTLIFLTQFPVLGSYRIYIYMDGYILYIYDTYIYKEDEAVNGLF